MEPITPENLLSHFRWSLYELNGYLHAIASRDAMNSGTDLDDPDWWATLPSVHINRYCGLEIQLIARRYVIARDFDILDETQAMMVWKLQHP
ncbi:hypothetical protein AB2M62_11860 [Sphingomonas sp. MMS12-HWE2-04]|uniref:hypothetical protein n=1 Tax=Sphingomonas sp. MMS12-HWE2-04 TaxID=3234199 RepID=UPI00384A72C9